jgi:hypothetical protein
MQIVPIWISVIYNENFQNLNKYFVLTICLAIRRICYLAFPIRINKLSQVSVPYPCPCHTPCHAPLQLYTPIITISWKRHKGYWYIVFIKCWGKSKFKKYRFFGYHRKFSLHSQIVQSTVNFATKETQLSVFLHTSLKGL